MKKQFKKLVILDKIILSEIQWKLLRDMAEEVVEYSGLSQKQVEDKLIEEHGTAKGAVCFSQFAVEHTTEEELNKRLFRADAVITCWTNIPDAVLKANPQIKYIGFWTNLVNHRINLKLAEEMNIVVTSIPDYATIAVSEYVFALLYEMFRRVAKQAKDTVRGKWLYELLKTAHFVPSIDQIPYHTLAGKKIGIIGLGRIGQQVAYLALAYGMEVTYFSPHRKKDWEDKGVKYLPLEEILKSSDIVTIHMSSYSDEKYNITKEKISLLKDEAIFINTSAGRLVDEDALIIEAESGRISIAIDVYRSNPERKRIQNIINKHGEGKNIFTYRGAWLTQESVMRKGDSLIKNIREFLEF